MLRGANAATSMGFALPTYGIRQGTLSLVLLPSVQVAPRVRVQGGAFAQAWGRNTGAGSGVLASLWLAY
jgi:hypothetical protein